MTSRNTETLAAVIPPGVLKGPSSKAKPLSRYPGTYAVYANGAVADSYTKTADKIEEFEKLETTEQAYEQASEFARRQTLPFALVYLPDPNLAAMYELVKKEFQDLLGLEPELEGRVDVQYDFGSGEMEPEDLGETEAEVEALKRQRAEIEKFPKLTVPCK